MFAPVASSPARLLATKQLSSSYLKLKKVASATFFLSSIIWQQHLILLAGLTAARWGFVSQTQRRRDSINVLVPKLHQKTALLTPYPGIVRFNDI